MGKLSCTGQTHRRGCCARISRSATRGLKFLTEAHEAGTDAKDAALVLCGVTNGMVAGTARVFKRLFSVQAMPRS
jgi:hypothetical protein